ncbi:hypothetical protein RRG08_049532 [Elysia crispata]|uniref:Uncharacterized protein n=1 Tax=Elysia crispata TaxID=231223 RepID=A0AAE1CLE9_9GAST|nr:hypothetical protein RRG08_049532 [Elysia crispata]
MPSCTLSQKMQENPGVKKDYAQKNYKEEGVLLSRIWTRTNRWTELIRKTNVLITRSSSMRPTSLSREEITTGHRNKLT